MGFVVGSRALFLIRGHTMTRRGVLQEEKEIGYYWATNNGKDNMSLYRKLSG